MNKITAVIIQSDGNRKFDNICLLIIQQMEKNGVSLSVTTASEIHWKITGEKMTRTNLFASWLPIAMRMPRESHDMLRF